jgi:protein AbiQ
MLAPTSTLGAKMENIKIYEISRGYIDYLHSVEPKVFKNSATTQAHERKYIGVVLEINGYYYFVPLSSYKEKHNRLKDAVDFVKIEKYAVLNINNMFPAPLNECKYVDFRIEPDEKYVKLLMAEYRIIKSLQQRIRQNAATVYQHKLRNGDATALSRRCSDFSKLERACDNYINQMA